MKGRGEPGTEKLKIKETLMQLTIIDQTPKEALIYSPKAFP